VDVIFIKMKCQTSSNKPTLFPDLFGVLHDLGTFWR
jgi:hypothetical protein